MFFKRRNESNNKKSYFPEQRIIVDAIKPDDWLVVELGQSAAHCLWFCNLYNPETKRQIFVEEYDTAQQALDEAIKQTPIKQGSFNNEGE